ncbi:MAG: alanine transaminase [Deltaproteobacteria bacterium]|nr:alanine transaminase [Deltaproteobacteria bacterium]
MLDQFQRIRRLPPYVFSVVNELKAAARARGEDIIDFGMGNPDGEPPAHVVEKLVEVVQRPDVHRYSMSRGIPRLRKAMCDWYKGRYDVELDSETECIVTIGSKEGLAHLALSIVGPGDTVLVPNPAYPIHPYGFVIAGADIQYLPSAKDPAFFDELARAVRDRWPKPKVLLLNYPANPTTECVSLSFFERVVDFAKEHELWVVQDLAYAEIAFDGYVPPSILQVPGAKDWAVEFTSLSKTYNMPGWRVGFMNGNAELVAALARMKSYMDYGMFLPMQVAAISALEGPQEPVAAQVAVYKSRRDVLCKGLAEMGWPVELPRATMFVWAPIPEAFRAMGSLEFTKKLLAEAKVAVSPGIGFGDQGDGHVRFSLIENEQRTRQALRGIRKLLK